MAETKGGGARENINTGNRTVESRRYRRNVREVLNIGDKLR